MIFSPLKIEIHLKNSVAMQKNKAAFDAILAMLYFNQQKNTGTFNGDYEQQLDFLAQTDGVYHTSFPQFVGVRYFDKEKLIKKFDHDLYAKFGEIVAKNGKPKGIVTTAQGKFKNEFFSIERIGVDSIVYYVNGHKETIESLLKHLRYIGKKSSLGWGEVKFITIEDIPEDCSIFSNGQLMRNIPIKNRWNATGNKVGLMRLMHPYWSKSELHECLIP